MRDLIIFCLVFGSIPLILARAWIGVIMWMWVSLMNPHKLAWGYMYDIPVALIIGVTTLAAWVFTKDDKNLLSPAHAAVNQSKQSSRRVSNKSISGHSNSDQGNNDR